jgi:hypothetical protein
MGNDSEDDTKACLFYHASSIPPDILSGSIKDTYRAAPSPTEPVCLRMNTVTSADPVHPGSWIVDRQLESKSRTVYWAISWLDRTSALLEHPQLKASFHEPVWM